MEDFKIGICGKGFIYTPTSASTETNILYTEEHTDRRTGRQADSSKMYTLENICIGGFNREMPPPPTPPPPKKKPPKKCFSRSKNFLKGSDKGSCKEH